MYKERKSLLNAKEPSFKIYLLKWLNLIEYLNKIYLWLTSDKALLLLKVHTSLSTIIFNLQSSINLQLIWKNYLRKFSFKKLSLFSKFRRMSFQHRRNKFFLPTLYKLSLEILLQGNYRRNSPLKWFIWSQCLPLLYRERTNLC